MCSGAPAIGGDEVALRVHTHVREDALQLYGFADAAERELLALIAEVVAPERLGPVRWLEDRPAYVKLEADSATPGGRSLVRYEAATGKREVWVPASRLVPPGDTAALSVEDYSLSPDGRRLLVFTNSKRVWRQNTRGDFWALDLSSWRLTQLGGSQANISAHLTRLRQAGLITSRTQGRAVYYRLTQPELGALLQTAGQLLAPPGSRPPKKMTRR